MTAALSSETALDIIASFGADPARWPDDARAAVLALVAEDAHVAAALAEAHALDAALGAWAAAPVDAAGVDVAAILALPQETTAPSRINSWRPALLAASLALFIAVGGWLGLSGQLATTGSTQIAVAPPSAGAGAGEADAAFAYVFTPTAAEEDLI